MDLPDEASVKQLLDLFTDEVLSLNGLFLGFLLDRSGIRIDFQMVLNHLPWDSSICDGFQASTSTLAWRNVTSMSSNLLSRSGRSSQERHRCQRAARGVLMMSCASASLMVPGPDPHARPQPRVVQPEPVASQAQWRLHCGLHGS
jgi:hypothetical protein